VPDQECELEILPKHARRGKTPWFTALAWKLPTSPRCANLVWTNHKRRTHASGRPTVTNQSSIEPSNASLGFLLKYTMFVVPLGTALGLIYLIGYWRPLGVNVLDYVGFADVLRLSLYPMLIVIVTATVGLLVPPMLSKTFPPGGGRETFAGRKIFGYRYWFWSIWAAVMIYSVVKSPEPSRWYILANMGSMFSVMIGNTRPIQNALPDPAVRFAVLFLALYITGVAFATGRSNAHDIKTGQAEHALDSSRLPEALDLRSTAQRPIMYAGKLGDRFALYETLTSRLVLVREDQIPSLALRDK
jgi:hypothetical protein